MPGKAATGRKRTPAKTAPSRASRAAVAKPAGKKRKPALLSGGNPQIARGDGAAPVRAYIAAMPGWTRAVGKRLDEIIAANAPGVRKAVRWNSPFYGMEGQGWFVSFHVFTRYVKVAFFRGTSLQPMPPGGTPKSGETRWLDLHEGGLDDATATQLAAWVRQASSIPGWIP